MERSPRELLLPEPETLAAAERVAHRIAPDLDVVGLLTERAASGGLTSRGRTSPGGSCRLLRAIDGWIAVNLARPSDVEAVEAITATLRTDDPWDALEAFAGATGATDAVARCQLLGVPAAMLRDPDVSGNDAVDTTASGEAGTAPATPRVVDLSTMWAGPLCARLLGRSGMEVTKVESVQRPDGARLGDPRFFGRMLDGHTELTVDLSTDAGLGQLRELLEAADVVIESSRPRALLQLGIDPVVLVAGNRGLTWVSITGYGRGGERGNWVAFGDDAAVAGGLVAVDDDGLPVFCGDAIADPLTGIYAAEAALRSVATGGGRLVEVRMASVARSVAEGPRADAEFAPAG